MKRLLLGGLLALAAVSANAKNGITNYQKVILVLIIKLPHLQIKQRVTSYRLVCSSTQMMLTIQQLYQ